MSTHAPSLSSLLANLEMTDKSVHPTASLRTLASMFTVVGEKKITDGQGPDRLAREVFGAMRQVPGLGNATTAELHMHTGQLGRDLASLARGKADAAEQERLTAICRALQKVSRPVHA